MCLSLKLVVQSKMIMIMGKGALLFFFVCILAFSRCIFSISLDSFVGVHAYVVHVSRIALSSQRQQDFIVAVAVVVVAAAVDDISHFANTY